jgi:quercetin dioxygenase-like cupin family protein
MSWKLPVFLFLAISSNVRPASAAEPADAKPLAARVQHYDKVPADESPWGSLRWMMNGKIEPGAGVTLGVVELKAGQSNPRHVHPNCEEVIYVLSGTCRHEVGKETVTLRPGDVLRIPAGVPHMATALGNEPSRSIVVYNTGERQFTPVPK